MELIIDLWWLWLSLETLLVCLVLLYIQRRG